jgi:hypothetical protein
VTDIPNIQSYRQQQPPPMGCSATAKRQALVNRRIRGSQAMVVALWCATTRYVRSWVVGRFSS